MDGQAQRIKPVSQPQVSLNVLSIEQVQQIHAATLEVIERVGVRFPSRLALQILAEHGALVDWEQQTARISGAVVEAALAKAPPAYTLAARDPALDLPLDGAHSYLGTDGCGVEIIDLESGDRRRTTKADLAQVTQAADALEAIAFHWVAVSAQDCPPQSRSLHELQAVWRHSNKHVQTESIVNAKEARAAVEMAAALAGGSAQLRARPILSIMQCTLSPLAQDGGSLEAALVAAGAGLPVGFMTMASAGASGPITLAGNLVVGNAEVVAALALMQMAHPGCPVYYAAAQTIVDLRTGAYTGGGPEDYLFGAATNKLADFYNVPLSMGAFATGAKEPDWQAGVDNSLSAFMALSTGADMLLGAGLLHGSRIFSYEQLWMDCEIWSLLENLYEGITISPETLAVDVIAQVGPGGSYLANKHTRRHMRARWAPSLMDRRPYNTWAEQGGGARQWARQQARELLSRPPADALAPDLDAELSAIIAGVEA